ncbi:uncharacterized protein LOC132745481 [Ruditapes philippinarum]|uniref:uncharacterized protein LOC132745481 n=1 Tax=Ruditapes philippinarum TaxID=129788 RepID=UPI00295BED61|nr:uncharacterized protein LOC132745481 [Ruditapes philippinarum]
MSKHQLLAALFLVALTAKVAHGCSCMGASGRWMTLEERVATAEFAALANVTSDVISSPKGLYYEINKECVLKTPNGTDVGRAYATSRLKPEGMRTSCDGADLAKDKVYLIIGGLYNRDNPDTDSVLYSGCGGFVVEWDRVTSDFKNDLKKMLSFDNC